VRDLARLHRDAVLGEQVFRLILKQVHRGSVLGSVWYCRVTCGVHGKPSLYPARAAPWPTTVVV
jgi:hypothetical protein